MFKVELGSLRLSAKFKLGCKSLKKNKFILILFVYNLMIGYAKMNSKNYPTKCF